MDYAFSEKPTLKGQVKKLIDDALSVKIDVGEKLIAPKYNHDRCERSVQMRLYTMSKQHFGIVFALFFTAFVLFMFLGLAGPPITTTVSRPFSQNTKYNETKLSTGPFMLVTPQLSAYCQQLWVMGQLQTAESNPDSVFESSFNVSVDIAGMSNEEKSQKTVATGNRTHKLSCKGSMCNNMILVHLGVLTHGKYEIAVRFYGLDDFDKKFTVKDVLFHYKSYNPAFSQLEIWVRFLFVALSFAATIWYFQTLRPYSVFHWSMEQKWMSMLLPLMLLYNNPLFPLIFLTSGWFASVTEGLFQATFLCALMLFWLCVYHGIRQSTRHFFSFYLPKLILVGLLWLSAAVLTIWDRINELSDPGWYSNDLDRGNFQGFKVFFYIVGGLYLAYLVFLVIRAYGELRNLPYFDLRLKFFTILMLLVIVVTIALTAMKFGVAPTLEDNFVANLSTQYQTSAEFVAIYALLNCYLFVMAFVYSPNANLASEFYFKDNPGVTLLNDEDEDDMIYSSSEFPAGMRNLSEDSD